MKSINIMEYNPCFHTLLLNGATFRGSNASRMQDDIDIFIKRILNRTKNFDFSDMNIFEINKAISLIANDEIDTRLYEEDCSFYDRRKNYHKVTFFNSRDNHSCTFNFRILFKEDFKKLNEKDKNENYS